MNKSLFNKHDLGLIICASALLFMLMVSTHALASTPLHMAVQSLDVRLFTRFISEELMINATDSKGMTPLHHACALGAVEMTSALLEKGADPTITCAAGKNALHYSVNVGAICLDPERPTTDVTICPLTIPQMLASTEVEINKKDNAGDTALHIASKNGMVAVIAALIQAGADANVQDENGNTALHLVGGPLPHVAAQVLLLNGAVVNRCNKEGVSPMQQAINNGNLLVINVLKKYDKTETDN